MDDWHAKVTSEMVDRTKDIHVYAKEHFSKWGEVFKLVMAAKIFPLANYETQGSDYNKPIKYLSVAISECSSPGSFGGQVISFYYSFYKLGPRTKFNKPKMRSLAKHVRKNHRVRRLKEMLFNPGQERERSLSPQEGDTKRHHC